MEHKQKKTLVATGVVARGRREEGYWILPVLAARHNFNFHCKVDSKEQVERLDMEWVQCGAA